MRNSADRVAALVGFALVAVPVLAATPETFTIAEIVPVTDLTRAAQSVVSSPKGRYVAWVAEGNLLVAREPDFKTETLVAREGGDAITTTYASADGRTVFYTRGASQPAFGSVPARDTRALWLADVERKSAPQLVASGADVPPSSLVFAPDGNAFAFAEGKVLYEFRRSSTGRWERRQLLQPNAQHTASVGIFDIVYSPDGQQIAFASERKAKQTYVAIHDIAKAETRYIEPSIYRDSAPVWSPDSRELAFVRVPGNWTMRYRFTPQHEENLRTPTREGVAWSILAADVRTGAVRTVFKADAGRGSIASTFTPIWTPDGRILFSWEKTGWDLLYSVPAKGGTPTLLTPGEGEIGPPVLSADGKTVVYDSNIDDLGRRHVWTLALSGGAPKRFDSGTGVERSPRVTAGGHIIYRVDYREPVAPPQLQARSARGEVRGIALLSPEGEKRNQKLWSQFLPEDVFTARADDGVTSYHLMIKPRTPPPPGGYPVVVHAHGGPTAQTVPGTSSRYLFGQYLASRGYLYLDINYRGSTGFGLAYRMPEDRGATGGSEVKDLAALAGYLRSRSDVNPKRVGIMGGSYGGHIVGLAMSRLPDDYAAGVSLYGVSDWVVEMKKDEQDDGPGSAPPDFIRLSQRIRIEDLAYESSPSAHLDKWRGPTLLTEGDLDPQGHMETTIDLGYRLLERGVPVEFYIEPAGGHNVFPQARVFEFFEKYLR